jgi:hypothetical protein
MPQCGCRITLKPTEQATVRTPDRVPRSSERAMSFHASVEADLLPSRRFTVSVDRVGRLS